MVEKIQELNTERNIFWALVSVIGVCAICYIYLINATIHNVVARENIESNISTLSLSIGNLEFQYITLSDNVTLPLAYSLGFQDVKEKTYISPKAVSYVSLPSNEI